MTWDLWQRWLHLLYHGFLSPEGQELADDNHQMLKDNGTEDYTLAASVFANLVTTEV